MKHLNRISLLFFVPLLIFACYQQPKGYTITGTAEGTIDGDTVYLCEMQGYFNMVPVDTAIIEKGQFRFEGETEGASIRFLLPIHNGQATTFGQFILENATIKATLGQGEDSSNVIEGGPNGELYKEFEAADAKFSELMDAPWQRSTDSTLTEAQRMAAQSTIDSLRTEQVAMHKRFITEHMPSALSDMLYGYLMNEFSEAEQEELLKLMGEKQPDMPAYKAIMAQREAQAATTVGKPFIDLTMSDPDGHPMKLSSFVGKNKYILVDFWASWCGPCRAEMPNVVKAYADFHDKGFEVIGVSFDNDHDAWVKAISQLQMPWPQMSDLKGWECAAAGLYNITGIPSNILLDEKGTIIAKDLRGEELLAKLAEVM